MKLNFSVEMFFRSLLIATYRTGAILNGSEILYTALDLLNLIYTGEMKLSEQKVAYSLNTQPVTRKEYDKVGRELVSYLKFCLPDLVNNGTPADRKRDKATEDKLANKLDLLALDLNILPQENY